MVSLGKNAKKHEFKIFVIILSILAGFAYNSYYLFNTYHIDDDARQHIFWTYKFKDKRLFKNDFLVNFFSSPKIAVYGWKALYYVFSKFFDPLFFSKILPIFLNIFCVFFVFEIGLKLKDQQTGFLSAMLFCLCLTRLLQGGFQRSFALPFFVLFLYCLYEKNFWLCGVSLLLQALFYPPIILNSLTMIPFIFIKNRTMDTQIIKKSFFPLSIFLSLAFIIVAYLYLFYKPEFIGRKFSYKEAKTMAEFWENGRSAFFNKNPLIFYFGKPFHYTRSGLGIFEKPEFVIVSFLTFMYIFFKKRKWVFPSIIIWLIISSLFLFILSHIFLFHLYQPSKYTKYTIPLAIVFLLAYNFPNLSTQSLKKLFVYVSLSFIIASSAVGFLSKKDIDKEKIELYKFLSSLPNDALIASHPYLANDIPLFSKRSVLVNEELSIAWYKNYYKEVKSRIYDTFKIIYAKNLNEAIPIIQKYKITHIVLSFEYFSSDYLSKEKLYWAPFNDFLKKLTRKRVFLFADKSAPWIVFSNKKYWVAETRKIKVAQTQNAR